MFIPPENLQKFLKDNKYFLSYYSGDGSIGSYTKMEHPTDNRFSLHLEIDLNKGQMKLTSIITPGFFELSSGWMQLAHPRFKELFEDRMLSILDKVYTL